MKGTPPRYRFDDPAAAKAAAEKRWGPRRIVHLGDLTEAQRRLVLALIEAARAWSKP